MEPPFFDTIQQNQDLPPGQDFEWLRTEGLARLQQLSGQLWTDYNLHDPGVTLLEALCYALTDLSSRASQPIPDLLAARAGGVAPVGTFVPAHEAFASHPLTCHDFERLLLNLFPESLKNAWICPQPGLAGQATTPGHYQVQVELHPAYYEPPASEEELARLRDELGDCLNTLRNLGEVFAPPTVLRPLAITVSGSLDLLPGYFAERVLAQVLAALAEALAPQPVAISLDRLRAEGRVVEDIFAGPVAENRLLMEDALPPRRPLVKISELLRHIKQVDGVRNLGQYRLHYEGPGDALVDATQVVIPVDCIPQLAAAATYDRLIVSQQGVPLRPNRSLVLQGYERLLRGARYEGGATGQLPEQRQFGLRGGTYHNLGRYDSVQHHFPALYGVGMEGPPVAADAERRAAIMQLKGYLLHFEQVLADFCARLENMGHFFSIAPSKAPDYTLLYDVPFVAPLLAGTQVSPAEAWDQDPAADARWQAYRADASNPYVRALQPTAGQRPGRLHQRYSLLTHLLARFGYTVQLQAPPEIADEHVQEYLVGAYEHLLTHLNAATYNRARARLPLVDPPAPPSKRAHYPETQVGSGEPAAPPTGASEAESGLELFLFLLTGLESIPRRWARHQQLSLLEAQVQWHEPVASEASAQLRVRFEHSPTQPLPEVLAALQAQLLLPGWVAAATGLRYTGPIASDPVPAATEVEWLGDAAPGAPQTPAPLRRYAYGLATSLVRVSLLDHLVLKPAPTAAATGPADPVGDVDFFHCQITVFLPAYAPAYYPQPANRDHNYAEARAYVEYLVQQHTPTHLLLNTVWLGYEAMREWEALYASLVPASGLLNATGRSEPTLPGIQAEALAFVRRQLALPNA